MALAAPAAIALVILGWRLVAPAPGPLSSSAPAHTSGAAAPAAPPVENPGITSVPTAAMEDAASFDHQGPAGEDPGVQPQGGDFAKRAAPAALPSAGPDDGRLASAPAPEQDATPNVLTEPPPDWPAVTLQMLFFSEEQNRSFVQVNGKTYRPGEALASGPQVLSITKDSVTLSFRGQHLLLGAER